MLIQGKETRKSKAAAGPGAPPGRLTVRTERDKIPEPAVVYYEPAALSYELGGVLRRRFPHVPWEPIENHNSIPFMQSRPNRDFPQMKRALVVGVRKTHRFVPNGKTSDFLVPYTSSGCTAACLYCYLVCSYNKCAYLRLFVNREEMLGRIVRAAKKSERPLVFEIGSNSDLVLENAYTGSLAWTVERFADSRGFLTLPTKFGMTGPLLALRHGGRTVVRMSVNPREIIRSAEMGTSPLPERIRALNDLARAGYPTGLLIAPVILLTGWRGMYAGLMEELADGLSAQVKNGLRIEIIFMTYSYVHRMINREAFPAAPDLFDPNQMTGRGRGRYCYRQAGREEAAAFLRALIAEKLPHSQILYIV